MFARFLCWKLILIFAIPMPHALEVSPQIQPTPKKERVVKLHFLDNISVEPLHPSIPEAKHSQPPPQ